jgi:hypothetical protein
MAFKNEQGKWLTKALFFEMTLPATRQHACYTLKDEDHVVDGKTYYSLYQKFIECDDPTEYQFAKQHLGGWSHWKALQNSPELAPYVEAWREERDVMMRSQGVMGVIEQAIEGNYQASKWLADKGWEVDAPKRGRPSKQEVEKETKQQAKVKLAVMNDYKRLKDG